MGVFNTWNPGYSRILEKFNDLTKRVDSDLDQMPFVWSGVEEDVMDLIRSDPDMEEYLRNNQTGSSGEL